MSSIININHRGDLKSDHKW